MARVSLDEAYDDRSVIAQIIRLKKKYAAQEARMDRADDAAKRFADKTDSEIARIDEHDAEQDAQISDLDALVRTYDERITEAQNNVATADANAANALETAKEALEDAEAADAAAGRAQESADKAQADATDALDKVSKAFISARALAGPEYASIEFEDVSDNETEVYMPVASSSQAGVINSSDYSGFTGYGARLDALEARGSTQYVEVPEGATQDEMSEIFREASGRDPEPGNYMSDVARGITWEYDGSQWLEVSNASYEPFRLGTAGLIVGSEQDGQIYAEADGTGSVVGWDALKSEMSGVQADIAEMSEGIETVRTTAENAHAIAEDAEQAAESKQSAVRFSEVTIPADAWEGGSATVEFEGMTPETDVICGASPATYSEYADAGVRLAECLEDALRFECDDAPVSDVVTTVAVF